MRCRHLTTLLGLALVAWALAPGGAVAPGRVDPAAPGPRPSRQSTAATPVSLPEGARLAPAGRRAPADASIPVLMYHVLADPPAEAPFPGLFVQPRDFRRHVAWLRDHGYVGVTLTDVWRHWRGERALPSKPVVLTFDDGYGSVASVALPVLRRVGWPGVLNLKLGNVPFGIRSVDVRRLVAAGWELGAHTLTHPDLTALDDATLAREVGGSRLAIETRFGVRVRFFCYPAGRYDERVVAAVRAAGFVGATTTEPGLARRTEAYTLDRIRVSRGDSAAALAASLRSHGA